MQHNAVTQFSPDHTNSIVHIPISFSILYMVHLITLTVNLRGLPLKRIPVFNGSTQYNYVKKSIIRLKLKPHCTDLLLATHHNGLVYRMSTAIISRQHAVDNPAHVKQLFLYCIVHRNVCRQIKWSICCLMRTMK
jgi:hypothetical protein